MHYKGDFYADYSQKVDVTEHVLLYFDTFVSFQSFDRLAVIVKCVNT